MTQTLIQLLNQTASLSADQQLELAVLLIEQARKKSASPRRKWLDVIGAAPYPLAGEDAQEWVTRSREDDTEREQ
ncbi:MAG TPA: hypothetical protein VF131_04150 [Blastocatellia bacterium]|nr:hypothetical protein [Blastocatellia bacterium]